MGKISTAVKDQVEAGLIATDGPVRVLVTKARYVVDPTYNKTNRGEDATTLCVTYIEKARRKDKAYKGDPVHISCGPVSRLIPCDDDGGKSVEAAEGSKAGGFGSSSNISIFYKHLEEALKDAPSDVDADDFDTTEDVSCLEMYEVTIDRVPQPERKGLKVNKPGVEGKPGTVVIWKEIHGAVEDAKAWRGAKGGADDDDQGEEKTGRGRRRKKPDEDEAEPDEAPKRGKGGGKASEAALEVLEKLLPDEDDAIDLEALAKKCYPIIKKDSGWAKQRTAIMAKLGDDEFLGDLKGFVVDEGQLRRL